MLVLTLHKYSPIEIRLGKDVVAKILLSEKEKDIENVKLAIEADKKYKIYRVNRIFKKKY